MEILKFFFICLYFADHTSNSPGDNSDHGDEKTNTLPTRDSKTNRNSRIFLQYRRKSTAGQPSSTALQRFPENFVPERGGKRSSTDNTESSRKSPVIENNTRCPTRKGSSSSSTQARVTNDPPRSIFQRHHDSPSRNFASESVRESARTFDLNYSPNYNTESLTTSNSKGKNYRNGSERGETSSSKSKATVNGGKPFFEYQSFADDVAGPSNPPTRRPPTTLDQAEAEELLLKLGIRRKMWPVPLHLSDGILCSVPPRHYPITHDLLTIKNIRIPVLKGIFQIKKVDFLYHPDEEASNYVLLQCNCEISYHRIGVMLTPTDFYFSTLVPAELVCYEGKIHLLRGGYGSNSFFIFSYDADSQAYRVLAHIIAKS